MAKQIVIDIYDESEGRLNGLINIKSQELELDYGYDTVQNFHGLQSAFIDERNDEQKRLLNGMVNIINKLLEIK